MNSNEVTPGEARKRNRASEPMRGPVRSAGEADSVRTKP